MKYVIIGAGACGIAAAKTVRDIDAGGEITILNGERFFPYYRYLLTDFLTGAILEPELFAASGETFAKLAIKFRKGELVKSINPTEKYVKLSHNEIIPYHKLLVASGSCPGLGTVLKPFEKFIQPYHSLQDIYVLKQQLKDFNNCVVYGTGLSSLDLLRGLSDLGKQVTYIFKGNKPDWSLLESKVYDELLELLSRRGIKLIANDRIISIKRISDHFRVLTLKQVEFTADLVFAWDHYYPNIPFIKATTLKKKTGILVNEQLKTSEDHIYAAGDCVEIYDPKIKNYWINFGWANALEQGITAGRNMTGEKGIYKIKESITVNLMGKTLQARWWK